MPDKLQIRRGALADLPTLDVGELGFITDTKTLALGDGSATAPKIPSTGSTGQFDFEDIDRLGLGKVADAGTVLDVEGKVAANSLKLNSYSPEVSIPTSVNILGVDSSGDVVDTAMDAEEVAAGAGLGGGGGSSGASGFAVVPENPTSLEVTVGAGDIVTRNNIINVSQQTNIGPFTIPTTNDRIDRVLIDNLTGAATIVEGAEAASPEPPIVPAGKRAVAQIYLTPSHTGVEKSDITREFAAILNSPIGGFDMQEQVDVASAATLTPNSSSNFYRVTGSTGISEIASTAPSPLTLRFVTNLTLTHSSSLVLPNLNDITTRLGDIATFYQNVTGTWVCTNYLRSDGSNVVPLPYDKYFWPTVAVAGGDSDHDIVFNTGRIIDSVNEDIIVLASALTKRLDATWVVGTGNGGLGTGSPAANATYHMFVIKNSSTGAVDAGFDTDIDAGNLLTTSGYDKYRRIHSFVTDSSANIQPFYQVGDDMVRTLIAGYDVNDITFTQGVTYQVALPIPTGIEVNVKLTGRTEMNNADSYAIYSNPQLASYDTVAIAIGQITRDSHWGVEVLSNDDGEVNFRYDRSAGAALTVNYLTMLSWNDPRIV